MWPGTPMAGRRRELETPDHWGRDLFVKDRRGRWPDTKKDLPRTPVFTGLNVHCEKQHIRGAQR